MKKISLLIFLIIVGVQFAFAQNAIAKLKFEDAEEAFVNNNFELTVSKLKEVETILKSSNPKILYLQILAQSKIIEKNPFNDFTLTQNTRKLSTQYLNDYENLPDNEDQYRTIYKTSESLKSYSENEEQFSVQKKNFEEKQLSEKAKLKYKEAEEAYYAHDFELTISKLKEAEILLGTTNPNILNLRTLAQSQVVANTLSDKPNNSKTLEFEKTKKLYQTGKITRAEFRAAIKVYNAYIKGEFIKLNNSLNAGEITRAEHKAAVKVLLNR